MVKSKIKFTSVQCLVTLVTGQKETTGSKREEGLCHMRQWQQSGTTGEDTKMAIRN